MTATNQKPLSILRRKEVEARTALSRSTLYERIRSGSFPAPINLGGKAVGWIEHEIDDWILRQIAQRGGSPTQDDGLAVCRGVVTSPSPSVAGAARTRYVKSKGPAGGPLEVGLHKGTESLDSGVGSDHGSY